MFEPPKPKEGEEPRPPPSGGDFIIWLNLLETYEQCKLYIPRLKKIMDDFKENSQSIFGQPKREPFATISHNDMWVNNTMQVTRGGKVVKNKLVDFQVYTYDSPAKDLLFFIWSSVQLPVLKKHFHDLVSFYYSTFSGILQKLGCELSPFTYDKFEEEMKASAVSELFHVIMMTRVIYGKKGEFAIDLSAGPGGFKLKEQDITDNMKERVAHIIQTSGRKGWI